MVGPLISVVVPVYNVEKYIDRCVRSILKQSYQNIEIILVNDGSTDHSSEICNRYANDNQNIFVIHQANGGLSKARNTGIEACRGEWIALVDSDDYISEDYLKILLELCIMYDADCSVCSYQTTNSDVCVFTKNEDIQIFTGYNAVISQFGSLSDIMNLATCKLYKTSLFQDVVYPVGKINEDFFVTHELLYKCNKVLVTKSKLYAYFQSDNSIMRSRFTEKRLDILDAYQYRINYYMSKNEKEIVNITKRAYCNRLFDAYLLMKKFLPDRDDKIKEIRNKSINLYNEVKTIKSYTDLNLKKMILMRFKQALGRYLPSLYNRIFVRNKNYI